MAECDFCSTQPVVRRFPCRDFTSASEDVGVTLPTTIDPQTNLVLMSKSYWAACEVCAGLVEAGDIDGLLGRALIVFTAQGRRLSVAFAKHLYHTYKLFFQKRLPDTPVAGVN